MEEEIELADLYVVLRNIIHVIETANEFVWWSGKDVFSVKHVYSVISELCEVSGSGEDIFLPLLSKV